MTIVEVILNGFWYGKPKRFISKDTGGNVVSLSKAEYNQMLINDKVIVLEA